MEVKTTLKVIAPQDIKKLKQQIAALEWQIKQDTNPKDKAIHQQALKSLQEQLLFVSYLTLQSKEFAEDILGWEPFKQKGHDLIIRVTFTWGWLRVYRTPSEIEWY